jgi:3alpha(or 20beta)-hydroxysteroid dehydrogenase
MQQDWDKVVAHCEQLGGLHGLVNNAGIYQPKPIRDTEPELLDAHFRVNQLGVVLGLKSVAPLMERSGGGSIVNVSSTAAAGLSRMRLPMSERNGQYGE